MRNYKKFKEFVILFRFVSLEGLLTINSIQLTPDNP